MWSLVTLRCPFRPQFLSKMLPSLKIRHQFSHKGLNFVTEKVKFPSDSDDIFKFMQNAFLTNEPITRAINCTPSDTWPLFETILENCSKHDSSFIARDNDGNVVGILLNTFYKFDELQRKFGNVVYEQDKTEFGIDISNGPYATKNANRIAIFLDWTESHIIRLPRETTIKGGLAKLEVMSVSPEYARSGVGSDMLRSLIKMGHSEKYSYLYCCATARASQKGLRKFGFEVLKKVPFNSFLDNGMPIFSEVHDKGDGAELMTLAL